MRSPNEEIQGLVPLNEFRSKIENYETGFSSTQFRSIGDNLWVYLKEIEELQNEVEAKSVSAEVNILNFREDCTTIPALRHRVDIIKSDLQILSEEMAKDATHYLAQGAQYYKRWAKDIDYIRETQRKFITRLDALQENSFAIFLENTGIVTNIYNMGTCEAFNFVLKDTYGSQYNWEEADDKRKFFWNDKDKLLSYFDKKGLSVNESEVDRLIDAKEIAMEKLRVSESSPLRHGVEAFIDEAIQDRVPIVILDSYSDPDFELPRSAIENLGSERLSKITVVGPEEVKKTFYGKLLSVSAEMEEELSNINSFARLKHELYREVKSVLKMDELGDFLKSQRDELFYLDRLRAAVVALRAGAEYGNAPLKKCVLVASSYFGVLAAQFLGVPCIVLESCSSFKAERQTTGPVMSSFGEDGLTLSSLRENI